MNWDATSVISVITAITTLVTAIGGTIIAIRQSGISKKVDEAKVATLNTAKKVEENGLHRTIQLNEIKREIKDAKIGPTQ